MSYDLHPNGRWSACLQRNKLSLNHHCLCFPESCFLFCFGLWVGLSNLAGGGWLCSSVGCAGQVKKNSAEVGTRFERDELGPLAEHAQVDVSCAPQHQTGGARMRLSLPGLSAFIVEWAIV